MSPFSLMRDTVAAVIPALASSERRAIPRCLSSESALSSCVRGPDTTAYRLIQNVGYRCDISDLLYHCNQAITCTRWAPRWGNGTRSAHHVNRPILSAD